MKKYLLLTILGLVCIIGNCFAIAFTSLNSVKILQDSNFNTKKEYLIVSEKDGYRSDSVVKWNGEGKKEQRAYAIVQETDTQIISTGYGDKELAQGLTYIIDKPIYENEKPSSTIDR